MTPEIAFHNLTDPQMIHTDLDHQHCACYKGLAPSTSQFVLTPKPQASLPDGGVCFRCGGMTVRTGSCTTCTTCGESGGCG